MSENNINIEKLANDLKNIAECMSDERYNHACMLLGIMIGKMSQKLEYMIKEKKDDPAQSI